MATTEENQKSDQLYETLHKKTWSRRTAGFLAGATVLGGFGMAGGVIASFLPPLLGALGVSGAASVALPSAIAVASNAALFGGAAAWLGMAIGADVGANAGVAQATIEEKEKREGKSPAAAEPTQAAPAKKSPLLNWKVSLAAAAIFATFGALIAINPITAVGVAMLGFKAGSAAAIIGSATVLGLFGTTMGVNFPHLTSKLAQSYGKLLKGHYFEKENAPAPEPALAAPAPEKPAPALNAEPNMSETQTRSFATRETRFSLTNILEKNETPATDAVLTR